MIRMFLHFLHQPLDLGGLGKVGGDGNRFPREAGGLGELIQGRDGFFAGWGFARGDEDLGAAGLEETEGMGGGISTVVDSSNCVICVP